MAVRNSATAPLLHVGEDLVDSIAEDDMAYFDENHQPKTHLLQDAVEYGDGGAIAREKIKQSNGSMLLILIASAMAAIGGVLFGYDMGIISGAMLQLKFQFDLSCIEQEMIVSSVLVGALIGSLLGGFFIDRFGRRLTIITNAVVFVVGAVILCLSQTFATLIIGRLIVGFAVAVSAIGECIYISEIAPSEKRGQLVLLNEVGISLGFLLAYLVNYVFIDVNQGWRYMFLLSAIPAVIQGVGSFYLPSSPRFLLLKNKDSEAFEKLKMLRGGADVTEELNAIRASIQTEQGHSVLDLFKSDDNMRQRMFIGIGLVFFQQATGQANVLYYAPTVFQLLGFHDDSAATLAAVGIGCIKICIFLKRFTTFGKAGGSGRFCDVCG